MTDQQYNVADKAIKTYRNARYNTLAFILFTVVNIFISFFGVYFLFSIYFCTSFLASGVMFLDTEAVVSAGIVGSSLEANIAAAISFIFGFLALALYVLFFVLSRKHGWAMIVLFVLFCLDTVFVVVSIVVDPTLFIDLIVHILMLVYMGMGLSASSKLKKIFPDKGVAVKREELIAAYEQERAQMRAEMQSAGAAGDMAAQEKAAPTDDVFPEMNAQPAQEHTAADTAVEQPVEEASPQPEQSDRIDGPDDFGKIS